MVQDLLSMEDLNARLPTLDLALELSHDTTSWCR